MKEGDEIKIPIQRGDSIESMTVQLIDASEPSFLTVRTRTARTLKIGRKALAKYQEKHKNG